MDAWGFLRLLSEKKCVPWSREKAGYPTNSELRRWLESGSVVINGKRPKPSDEVVFPVDGLVFFPKSSRVTLR